jgi:hypothetical protein
MSKLIKNHGKAGFLQITIQYGDEKISFNLLKELAVSEETINSELKLQPSKYGFCLLLHKKLLTRYEQLCKERKRMWGKLFYMAKETKGSNGRLMSDDLAKAYVEKHKDYATLTKACIQAKDDADTIYACIKSFEQRKDVIQTLSSNIRSQS